MVKNLIGKELSQSEKDAILKERAIELSRIKSVQTKNKDLSLFISFYLCDECYGINIKYLQELYETETISSIPCTPNFFAGLINFRGSVLTIIDLKELFGLSDYSEGKNSGLNIQGNIQALHSNYILIIDLPYVKCGILVDQIGELIEVPNKNIKDVSTMFLEKNPIITREFQKGSTPVLVIDAEILLDDERLLINEDV